MMCWMTPDQETTAYVSYHDRPNRLGSTIVLKPLKTLKMPIENRRFLLDTNWSNSTSVKMWVSLT
jgi:hypothetical protein